MGSHRADQLGSRNRIVWGIVDAIDDFCAWLTSRHVETSDELGSEEPSAAALNLDDRDTPPTDWVAPETDASTDPANDPAEPAATTLTVEQAIDQLHADHPDLPRDRLAWHIYDDGAHAEVHVLEGTEAEHRAIVQAYAAALDVDMEEHGPVEGGHGALTAAGEYAGTRLVILTVLWTDFPGPLRVLEETEQDPGLVDLDNTQAFAAIRVEDGPPRELEAVEA